MNEKVIPPIIERERCPVHPGRVIKYGYLKPLGMSVTELSKRLGVSRKTASKLVNEKCSVTTDMAIRLSRVFDTTPELWLNLQINHDVWCMLHKEKEIEDD